MTELMKLNYNYQALEPTIDALTMEIHHSKHHQAYVDNYNKVIAKYPDLAQQTVENVLKEIKTANIDETDKQAIINFGGGVANHNLFWQIMDPTNQPDSTLIAEIKQTFGSLEAFKEQFTNTALKQFGSGWAWLVRNSDKQLAVYSLPNQDSPLSLGQTPVLTLDVWEHAYYLKYQNKRANYIKDWWSLIKLIQVS